MLNEMTVKIRSEDDSKTVENVISLINRNNSIIIKKKDEQITFNHNWSISEVHTKNPEANTGDWIKYVRLEAERIGTGKVTETYEDEIVLKTLPDGFQVSIQRNQVISILDRD